MRTAKVFRCFPAFVSNGSFFQRSDRGRHRIGRPRVDDLKVAVVGCMVPMVRKPFGDVKRAHPYELSIAQPSLQTFECATNCGAPFMFIKLPWFHECHPRGLGNQVPSFLGRKVYNVGPPLDS
jgi:hypothetical protein